MATIADKSRTKEIIERLQGIINNASPVPLGAGKVVVYKDEVQSLLTELATQIDTELKTYHEVNDRRGKLITEAKKEAEQIIYQAEHTASRMRVNRRATNVAPLDYDLLDEEERTALGSANEIYAASLIYTDEMLTEVTDMITDAYNNIRSDYEVILQVMEEKLNTISNNRAELMDGLQEMEVEDRSQQILEIGQLLSNELYNSRMKARMNSDEYEDGSVQLRLDLQEEQEEKTRQAEEKAEQAAVKAEQAAAKAEQAVAALEQMTAERDALRATVNQMKQEEIDQTAKSVEDVAPAVMDEAETNQTEQQSVEADDEEEYEIVYVSEDELEEGEEYEIEYVDEEEYEAIKEHEAKTSFETEEPEVIASSETEEPEVKAPSENAVPEVKVPSEDKEQSTLEVKEVVKDLDDLDSESEKVPIIPHFRKSQRIVSASSEKIAKMATAITTEKKYTGMISRAVVEQETGETLVPAEKKEEVSVKALTEPVEREKPKEEIKTDENGDEYVQATMQFDEDFEIMEF